MTQEINRTSTYTLAQHTPLLREKQLCEFLNGMDREEQQALVQEQRNAEEQINNFDEQNKFWKTVGKIGSMSGVIGAYSSAIGAGMAISAGNFRKSDFLFTSLCGSMVAGGGCFFLWLSISSKRSDLINELNSTTESARILRLQHKIRQVDSFIKASQDDALKEQAEMAKDYFKLKEMEMMRDRMNVLKVRRL